MKKHYLFVLSVLLFYICFNAKCEESMNMAIDKVNSYIYYGGFSGYRMPVKPIEKLSKTEALSRRSYCIGYYDVDGKLIRFEKYLDGSLFFQHEYRYHENGKIKEYKLINKNGETHIYYFDKKGKEIKK